MISRLLTVGADDLDRPLSLRRVLNVSEDSKPGRFASTDALSGAPIDARKRANTRLAVGFWNGLGEDND